MQEQEGAEEFDVFPYIVRLIYRTASGVLLTCYIALNIPTRVVVKDIFLFCRQFY